MTAPLATAAHRIRFVLVAPTHPGNIGAAARAIKTMGFGHLVVVQPKHAHYREHPDAVALATGAADVLADSRSFDVLADALGGVHTAYAMTGYDRQFGAPLADLRSCRTSGRHRTTASWSSSGSYREIKGQRGPWRADRGSA